MVVESVLESAHVGSMDLHVHDRILEIVYGSGEPVDLPRQEQIMKVLTDMAKFGPVGLMVTAPLALKHLDLQVLNFWMGHMKTLGARFRAMGAVTPHRTLRTLGDTLDRTLPLVGIPIRIKVGENRPEVMDWLEKVLAEP
jgi:hypothetical protein